MRTLLALALALAAAAPSAQPVERMGEVCTLYATPGGAVSGPDIDLGFLGRRSGDTFERVVTTRAATFQVDYTGFTAEAQAAFQRAVDIWADHLTSAVTIRINARFATLPPGVLGSAGPRLTRDFAGRPRPGTWYPFALADAVVGSDLFPAATSYDIEATFSSNRTDFYFGLDGSPPANRLDFVTIVLHELGHGLGFVGSGDVDDGAGDAECNGTAGVGCWGIQNFPYIFDRLVVDGAGQAFLNEVVYPNNSFPLGDLLQSQDLFVNSTEVLRIYGEPAPIWAPVAFEQGSSFSHWDEVLIQSTSAALMTPAVGFGEAYQDPGNITCAFFADMGWPLGAGCQLITTPTDDGPAARAFGLEVAGPNPFSGATAVRLRQLAPGPARVVLQDALGREVAVLWDGPAGADVRLAVPAGGLAPGLYRVVARSEAGVRAQTLALVR